MKVKSGELICDSCKNKSICKSVEDAKEVRDAYDRFVNIVSIPENCVFTLTQIPIVCPHRDPIYQTR